MTSTRRSDSPGSSRHAAKRCLVDWLGCAIGGVQQNVAVAVRGLSAGGDGPCTILGVRRGALPRDAAFANATAGHVLDLDDESDGLYGHPGATVVPATLAVAEAQDLTVGHVLRGMLRGYDTAANLGGLVNPEHYLAGWHATATLGALAAADACGVVIACPPSRRAGLVGVAATCAAGLRSAFGTDAKALQVGNASSAAVTAALLSTTVNVGTTDIVHQYLSLVGPAHAARSYDLADVREVAVTARPAIVDTTFKWHAACGAAHCAIDAMARIVKEESIHLSAIARISVKVGRLTAQTAGITAPRSAQQAQFSLPHLAALSAERYPIRTADLWPVSDEVARLRAACHVETLDGLGPPERHSARVEVTLTDGRVVTATVRAARGTVESPLSDDDLGAKFVELVRSVAPAADASGLVDWLWRCPDSTSVRTLMRVAQQAIGTE